MHNMSHSTPQRTSFCTQEFFSKKIVHPKKVVSLSAMRVHTNEEATVYVQDFDLSWKYRATRTHRQFYRLANSATMMNIPMSGAVVKNRMFSSRWQKDTLHHGELRAYSCPNSLEQIFEFRCGAAVNYIFITGLDQNMGESWLEETRSGLFKRKRRTTQHGETRGRICHNG